MLKQKHDQFYTQLKNLKQMRTNIKKGLRPLSLEVAKSIQPFMKHFKDIEISFVNDTKNNIHESLAAILYGPIKEEFVRLSEKMPIEMVTHALFKAGPEASSKVYKHAKRRVMYFEKTIPRITK